MCAMMVLAIPVNKNQGHSKTRATSSCSSCFFIIDLFSFMSQFALNFIQKFSIIMMIENKSLKHRKEIVYAHGKTHFKNDCTLL